MLDVPPEISVALSVVQALNASGRCREDAPLYASASALVQQYLAASLRPTAEAPAPVATPAPVSPPNVVYIPPTAASYPVPQPAAVPSVQPHARPLSAPPRPDALWHAGVPCWVIPRPGASVLPTPPTHPPRGDALWHDGVGSWLIPSSA